MPRAFKSPGVLEACGFGKNCIKKKTVLSVMEITGV